MGIKFLLLTEFGISVTKNELIEQRAPQRQSVHLFKVQVSSPFSLVQKILLTSIIDIRALKEITPITLTDMRFSTIIIPLTLALAVVGSLLPKSDPTSTLGSHPSIHDVHTSTAARSLGAIGSAEVVNVKLEKRESEFWDSKFWRTFKKVVGGACQDRYGRGSCGPGG